MMSGLLLYKFSIYDSVFWACCISEAYCIGRFTRNLFGLPWHNIDVAKGPEVKESWAKQVLI